MYTLTILIVSNNGYAINREELRSKFAVIPYINKEVDYKPAEITFIRDVVKVIRENEVNYNYALELEIINKDEELYDNKTLIRLDVEGKDIKVISAFKTRTKLTKLDKDIIQEWCVDK